MRGGEPWKFSHSGQEQGRNLHGFLGAMVVFCRRVARRRVHACALLSCGVAQKPHGRRKFSGDNAWLWVPLSSPESLRNIRFPSGGGCAFCGHHSRAQSREFDRSQIRGSAFGYRTCMVSVPMPILFVLVFFAGSGSASFFSPHDLSETDIKCNIFNAISILYTGIYNCQSRKREEIGGRKKVNSTMYLYIIIYNF